MLPPPNAEHTAPAALIGQSIHRCAPILVAETKIPITSYAPQSDGARVTAIERQMAIVQKALGVLKFDAEFKPKLSPEIRILAQQ
jgi:hypothetical protein